MSSNDYCLVITTLDDADKGQQLAAELVQQKWVACVNILPGMTSVYSWQGQIESATEVLLIMKTLRRKWPGLRDKIAKMHPYQVPEILQLDIRDGLPAYLQWIGDCCAE